MHVEVPLHGPIDLAQEAHELLRPVTRLDVSDDETPGFTPDTMTTGRLTITTPSEVRASAARKMAPCIKSRRAGGCASSTIAARTAPSYTKSRSSAGCRAVQAVS